MRVCALPPPLPHSGRAICRSTLGWVFNICDAEKQYLWNHVPLLMGTRNVLGRRHEEEIKQKGEGFGRSLSGKGLHQLVICSMVVPCPWTQCEHGLWWHCVPCVSHGVYRLWGGWDIKQHLEGRGEEFDFIQHLNLRWECNFQLLMLLQLYLSKLQKPNFTFQKKTYF